MDVSSYKRGIDFPHEGFVQVSLEKYFEKAGFKIDHSSQIDLLCKHPMTNETWHIEAKGKTTQIGLDFRTGIGQLIQGIDSELTNYGIAVPDIEEFRHQVAKVAPWVVSSLRIHWLYISNDGNVSIVYPKA
jgi:hypothetical protein